MKNSWLVAVGISLALVLWMWSGSFNDETPAQVGSKPVSAGQADHRMTVEVTHSEATDVMQHIVAQGQVEPDRIVTVRAEVSSQIAELPVIEGSTVQTADILAQLETNDRQARLQRAEALLRERQRAYDRDAQLGDQGFQAQGKLDASFSELQAARADLAAIRLEISNLVIRAPFAGSLEQLHVVLGESVGVGGEIATIVDNDPLVVVVQVAQQDIKDIAIGQLAEVLVATGEKTQGNVRFVSARADSATRTFRVEIEVPNTNSAMPSGMSAQARIPTGTVSGHFISPALLSLDDSGRIGVKTVDEDASVQFHPVTIVTAQSDGVWVTGLAQAVRIITVGHGFVRAGDKVETKLMSENAS